MSTITLYPCPHHFNSLWRNPLDAPTPTKERLKRIRQRFLLPKNDTLDAELCCTAWGVKSIDDLATIFTHVELYKPHGFLVMDGQFIGPRYSLSDLELMQPLIQELQLPPTILSQAQELGLPKTRQRSDWVASMGEGATDRQRCVPSARRMWPRIDPALHDTIAQYIEKQQGVGNDCPSWVSYLEPWFVVHKLGL